jgi:hypothetical protein
MISAKVGFGDQAGDDIGADLGFSSILTSSPAAASRCWRSMVDLLLVDIHIVYGIARVYLCQSRVS